MSVHQQPPQPSLPPLAKLARMLLNALTVIELVVRCERRVHESEIKALRNEIDELRREVRR